MSPTSALTPILLNAYIPWKKSKETQLRSRNFSENSADSACILSFTDALAENHLPLSFTIPNNPFITPLSITEQFKIRRRSGLLGLIQ